jgi:ribonuclease BN (tRNA processing enzyme)
MRIEFFGVRGTRPISPRRGTAFGGHTPSALVRTADGANLILDAGTGLLRLERALRARGENPRRPLHLMLTHLHFDHISGLPFLKALYRPETDLRFYSAESPASLRRHLEGFMTAPYFPVEFAGTPARKKYRRIASSPQAIGGAFVSSHPLNHPQGCAAYRIEENGRAIVFATDTEPSERGVDARLAAFALGADILVYDATYTQGEIAAGKRGWGHSTWAAGVDLARATGAGRLILSHLNPDHSDADIRRLEASARRAFARAIFAREGMILILEN